MAIALWGRLDANVLTQNSLAASKRQAAPEATRKKAEARIGAWPVCKRMPFRMLLSALDSSVNGGARDVE